MHEPTDRDLPLEAATTNTTTDEGHHRLPEAGVHEAMAESDLQDAAHRWMITMTVDMQDVLLPETTARLRDDTMLTLTKHEAAHLRPHEDILSPTREMETHMHDQGARHVTDTMEVVATEAAAAMTDDTEGFGDCTTGLDSLLVLKSAIWVCA